MSFCAPGLTGLLKKQRTAESPKGAGAARVQGLWEQRERQGLRQSGEFEGRFSGELMSELGLE